MYGLLTCMHTYMIRCIVTLCSTYLHINTSLRSQNLSEGQVDKLFWIATLLGPHVQLKSFKCSTVTRRVDFHRVILQDNGDKGKARLEVVDDDYANLDSIDAEKWIEVCKPPEDPKQLPQFYIKLDTKGTGAFLLFDKTTQRSQCVAAPGDPVPKINFNCGARQWEVLQHGTSNSCMDIFLNPESYLHRMEAAKARLNNQSLSLIHI